MLNQLDFNGLIETRRVENGYMYEVKTDICKYGNFYHIDCMRNRTAFLNFYYPMYKSDYYNHLLAEDLPY